MDHSVVVGGTRGAGRELVKIFSNEGHHVSVIGRNPPVSKDLELHNVSYCITELTDDRVIDSALEKILQKGKIRNLVFTLRNKGNSDPWEGEIHVSLTITRKMIDKLLDAFSEHGQKSIVITSSIVSHLIADEQPVGYHVAKAGLNQMARYYAVKLGVRGIRVNTVSPSIYIKDESQEYYRQNEQLCKIYNNIIPLGRIGTATEVANVMAFLCSPQASYITGQDIIVDGGISLHAQPSLARKLSSIATGLT